MKLPFSKDWGIFGLISGTALSSVIMMGCVNPFAPAEGDLALDLWESQSTVGGMLRNFQTAYMLQDSLRYSELLADEFVFQYWNAEPGHERYDQWYRETDLRATGGLMREFDRLDLRWGDFSSVDEFSQPDTTIEFFVTYMLAVEDFSPFSGSAFFRVRKGEDNRFRIVMWRDDF
ncbi:hypothetical protein K8I28_13635 [bacterium]|nr:hypothetical protein [bacterium]